MDTKKKNNNDPSLRTFEKLGHALEWQDVPGDHPYSDTQQIEGSVPEKENYTPVRPTFEELEQEKRQIYKQYLLDPREDYPEPYTMLEFNGVPFSKIGGLSAISGQKKNGKSFVLTQLMAAILGYDTERVQTYLQGMTVPQRSINYIGHPPRLLYVDTEMEKLSSAKVLRRVHWLCEWDMRKPNDRFFVLWLKTMPKNENMKPYKQRYEMIKYAIDDIHPDVVIIDGLRDIISSINDEESGTHIIDELGTLAEERKMSIWLALHQNPGRDSEEAKMRGWIGTELGNKVSDTLVSIKNKTPNGVTFKVTQQDARDKDMEDWKFEITDDAGKLGIPKIIGHAPIIKDETVPDSDEDILKWLNIAKTTCEWPMSRNHVKEKVFKKIGGQTNAGKLQADVVSALKKEFLVETIIKGKGGAFLVDIAKDLPF